MVFHKWMENFWNSSSLGLFLINKLENRAFFCSVSPPTPANISGVGFGDIFFEDESFVIWELVTFFDLYCYFAIEELLLSGFDIFLSWLGCLIALPICECFFYNFYFLMEVPLLKAYFYEGFKEFAFLESYFGFFI